MTCTEEYEISTSTFRLRKGKNIFRSKEQPELQEYFSRTYDMRMIGTLRNPENGEYVLRMKTARISNEK